MVDKYTAELELSAEHVSQILERLRTHAVEKLAARNKFQKTGVATLKARLAGCIPENVSHVVPMIPGHHTHFIIHFYDALFLTLKKIISFRPAAPLRIPGSGKRIAIPKENPPHIMSI